MKPAQRFLAKLLGPKQPVVVIAKCPKCGDEIGLDSSRVGSDLTCPNCDEAFTVNEAAPVPPLTTPRKSQLTDGRVIVMIGSCAGRTEAADHVQRTLGSHGIQAFTHGSRAYAIEVLESDVERARKILRRDPAKRRYAITVYKY